MRWRRTAFASLLGALWAVLAQLPGLRFLASPVALAALSLAMANVAMPPDSMRAALTGALALLGGGVFLGGMQLATLRLFEKRSPVALLLGALLGALALGAATALRKRRLVTWEVQVFLAAGGGGSALPGAGRHGQPPARTVQRPAGAHLRAQGARGRTAIRL